ncbi:FAD-binding domain-containing protein [Aquipuribacter nitratireducens]|uniref:FAD-binding domain-containing protein n=1 Tax=Aquipuribacter nitratireducens TaxID=650104 RepID=A0ABW0GNS7_9MICO
MSTRTQLPTPGPDVAADPDAAVAWVGAHLGDLALEGAEGAEGLVASPAFRGGQPAADAALAALDVTGYAARRNEVWPEPRRGASRMSPYIRHGLVDLRSVWDRVADAPSRDRQKYRDELLWQEYARHVHARTGRGMRAPLRHEPAVGSGWSGEPWPAEMACMRLTTDELRRDGWLVNQTRMWLASQWTVRAGWDWREGEEEFFRHLLDGSRAANRLGWQWTVGAGTGRPYGFSRWQVEKRAPGVCAGCPLRERCPVDGWPDTTAPPRLLHRAPGLGRGEPGADLAGPSDVVATSAPRAVWLTFESLGDADPALDAHPELPVVVVFDEPLLARLRLSAKRLVFLAETVASLATRHDVEVHRGRPGEVLHGRDAAVTHAPVPGFGPRAVRASPAEVHPWPWLVRPGAGSVRSFTAWRKGARV